MELGLYTFAELQPDPITGGERATSLPLFVRQISGPRLVGKGDCQT